MPDSLHHLTMRWIAREWVSLIAWSALVLLSAIAWYLTGRGVAFGIGFADMATGAGIVTAAIAALTLVALAREDLESRALAELRCPTCGGTLETRHEHAEAAMPGRQLWACGACGFAKMAPLTCDLCAT